MQTELDDIEEIEEVVDVEDEIEDEVETTEVEDGEAEDAEAEEEDDGEEIVITIGGEAEEEEKAPQWVRDLRRENAEKNRRIKELEAQVNGTQEKTELRAKPSLADHDYDDAAYEADLDKWHEEKREHDRQQAEVEKQQQAEAERWQSKLAKFEEGKKALKVKDLDEAEAVVVDTFNQMQMGIVVEGAKEPALVFYALGKNPTRAAELAKISNPIEFARAVFELEGKLQVSNSKAPPPERRVKGGSGAGSTDNKLDKLREEAARTGDFSKVVAYKKKLKSKKA